MSKQDQPVTNGELRKAFRWQDAAIVIAILGGFGSGYLHLISEARAQADAGIATVKTRLDAVEDEQRRVRLDVQQKVDEVKADVADVKTQVKEVQGDIRALYRYIQSGKTQPRLETPVDGGQPRRCVRCPR